MKKFNTVLFALLFLCTMALSAMASKAPNVSENDLKVEIISPSEIDSVPIHNDSIEIRVTNQGTKTYENLICYLIVIDVGRSQTYPVDEFGENAYQTREITSLAPKESKTIFIPVHIMYVGVFRFTASVLDLETGIVTTAYALPVTMTATSDMNKTLVMIIAAVVPVCLCVVTVFFTKKRGNKKA